MSREVFTGPIPGRIVFGHPAKAENKKDQQRNVIMKDGKPVQQWVFGIAFPKDAFAAYIYPHMDAEAKTLYPNGVPPGFSWKYKDGDGVDRRGRPYNERPGYAGCWVLTVSTEAFAPPIYKDVGGQWVQMQPEEIKCGDFAACVLDLKANAPQNASHTPGIYVNPKAVIFAGYGEEIVPRASFDPSTLGAVQFQPVAGMSATPLVPMGQAGVPGVAPGVMQPAMPGQVPMQQPAVNPMMPAAQPTAVPAQQPTIAQSPGYPAAQPGMMPAPAHDFVQNAGMQPQMQPAAQPMVQQPGNAPVAASPYPVVASPVPGSAPMMQPGMMPGR